MKYKLGDRVRIKNLDWYNENKDDNREIKFENGIFTTLKSTFLGQIMTIEEITLEKQYILMEDRYKTLWTDEMIEGLVEEETHRGYYTTEVETTNESKKVAWFTFWDNDFADKVELDLSNRELIQEDGKWFVVKKKKEYPKTYEECLKVLGFDITRKVKDAPIFDYDDDIIALQRLKRCRDAYWKIAGDEMGLGKPWEPDWTKADERKYCIVNTEGNITKWVQKTTNKILAFPTEEMGDAFKENFDPDIEICKELL